MNEQLHKIRHSLAHILARAVLEIYPQAKLAIGPAIDNGFYYDIDFQDISINDSDLKEIYKKMKHLIKQNHEFVPSLIDIDQAILSAKKENNPYKLELLKDLKETGEEKVSFYSVANFTDLCKGPHVQNTKEINIDSFKLDKLAGAYWRGDEKNKMLTRIYGLAFENKEELDKYIEQQKEAKKRDHRKLGKELELFMLDEVAPGMPFILPKGMIVLQELLKFVRQHSYGPEYQEIRTPHLLNAQLWKTSGHWDHYQEDMFILHHQEDNTDIGVKPMNCPAHMLVFKNKTHSYKDLPIRLAETSTLYRNERSGTLHGLTRVRSLSQDDSHIFVRPDQIQIEIIKLFEKIKFIWQAFGLSNYQIFLSTRPEKFLGSIEIWDQAEKDLKEALEKGGLDYKLNEGDGAFYGPKIDVVVSDAIGREWQLSTIQLDFQLPERFDLNYTDSSGQKQRPVIIHRALLGSLERFFGIIIEHFAGAFPLWLSPTQIKILTISDKHLKYALKLKDDFIKEKLRVDIDNNNETISNKIRKAVAEKIPYLIIIGDKEVENNSLNVRARGEQKSLDMKSEDLMKEIIKKIINYSL
jgi:threonyl-tRNA synthetase